MTSTSFNIGMDLQKNSSRVLRPPGGGHSDIFGIKENETDIVTPKKKNQPQSNIAACFGVEDNKPVETENHNEENGIKNGTNENDEVDENKAPEPEPEAREVEKEEPQPQAAPARRGRVPPGGYSTGFW